MMRDGVACDMRSPKRPGRLTCIYDINNILYINRVFMVVYGRFQGQIGVYGLNFLSVVLGENL